MAKKARVKDKELADLVDLFEGTYMYVQPRPETVSIEDDCIRVSYDALRTVKPLTHSDLFTSLAKLAAHGEPSEARIRSWVGRFGLPVWRARPEREGVVLPDKVPKYKPMSMKVHDFRKETQNAHRLLDLYLMIRKRNATELKWMVWSLRYKTDQKSALDNEFLEAFQAHKLALQPDTDDKRRRSFREAYPVNYDEAGIRAVKARLRDLDSMITLLAAQSALGQITTNRVADVRLRVGLQRGEGLTPSWYCPDLLSAIYLQFYLLITKSKPIEFCKNPPCRQPFVPDSSKHIYCSDSCRSNSRHYPIA